MSDEAWEYGFYDSHPDGDWSAEPKPQPHPTIFWYVFGFPLTSRESAERSGSKSTYGRPIIVRRHHEGDDWEHVPEDAEEPIRNSSTERES